MPSANIALDVAGISKNFGGLAVLRDVSFRVEIGEILGLIGPNGAGKSTLFEIIGGGLAPVSGRIGLFGNDITNMPPHARRRAGLCRTFQKIRLFESLSVVDNVRVAATEAPHPDRRVTDEVDAVLEMMQLGRKRELRPPELTLADRKRVEIARAVVGHCRLLLLDESLSGLTRDEAAGMVETIRHLNSDRDITIVLVEHVMPVVMALAQRLVVLQYGEVIAHGTPQQVVHDPHVIEAYLGQQATA